MKIPLFVVFMYMNNRHPAHPVLYLKQDEN